MFKNKGSEDTKKILTKGHWGEYKISPYSLILYILKIDTIKNSPSYPLFL